jgi:tetraprenyl-beta-curcumene synthase
MTIPATYHAALDTSVLIATLTDYWTTIFPQVRRELSGWRREASRVADPHRRRLALDTLAEEGSLAEGAAIFATLAPRRHRRDLVRLLVAWQVAYDYLDTLGESSAEARRLGCRSYSPLLAALDVPARTAGSTGDGYLDALVLHGRRSLDQLPSAEVVRDVARRAAVRCIEAQVLTHATVDHGSAPLRSWALIQERTDRYLWWELAAGAISSLGVHALLASAALTHVTADEAQAIDAAYYPAICAVSTLLDSMIDSEADAGTTNHRVTDYYSGTAHALARIETITRDASAAARRLRCGRRHHVILAGMTALYASLDDGPDHRVHDAVAAGLGSSAGPIRWSLRLRDAARNRRHFTSDR